VEFINNLKAERSGKKIDVEILEGELPDDVCDTFYSDILIVISRVLPRFTGAADVLLYTC